MSLVEQPWPVRSVAGSGGSTVTGCSSKHLSHHCLRHSQLAMAASRGNILSIIWKQSNRCLLLKWAMGPGGSGPWGQAGVGHGARYGHRCSSSAPATPAARRWRTTMRNGARSSSAWPSRSPPAASAQATTEMFHTTNNTNAADSNH